jgi:hypothetical protein
LTRFDARDSKTTKRPPADVDGPELPPLLCRSAEFTLTRAVLAGAAHAGAADASVIATDMSAAIGTAKGRVEA